MNVTEASDAGKDLIAVTDPFASLDGAISRVTGLQDHGGSGMGQILEGYNYLGTGDIVIRNRPQNQTQLSYIQQLNDTLTSSDGGDKYTGLDRFGRVIDQNWLNLNPGSGGSGTGDRFQYWYDRGGDVLYQNVVGQGTTAGTYSELFHTSGGLDGTGYDNLGRIVSFERGTLSHTNAGNVDPTGHNLMDTVATANKSQTWALDAQGNWTNFASTGQTTQTRTFNTRNQISTITGTSVTYDANGNVKIDDQGINYTYDAWNRLVTASKNGGFFEVYTYDADGRRPGLTISGGNVYDSYYSIDWQVLQDNLTPPGCGGTITQSQYVWGMGYVDDLILRDFNTDNNGSTGSLGITSSGLEQRLYAQQDANWNVTSLVDTTGAVKERFTYDPYGSALVLTGAWASTAQHLGSDTYGWIYGFQTGRYDPQTGLYNFRERDYSTTLGRFIEVDPILYGDGTNYYQFEQSDPVGGTDPLGLSYDKINGIVGIRWNEANRVTEIGINISIEPNWWNYVLVPVCDWNRDNVNRTIWVPIRSLPENYASNDGLKRLANWDKDPIHDNSAPVIIENLRAELRTKEGVQQAMAAGRNAAGITGLGPTGEGLLAAAGMEVVGGVVQARGIDPEVPNPWGQKGAPDHQATVDRLEALAKKEFPGAFIRRSRSIKSQTGVNRCPDVWVEDPATQRVLKVYEAARRNKNGTLVSREGTKQSEYNTAGIPSHFEPVP